MTLPTYALMSFSVEFCLKNFLAERRVPQNELSARDVRHNLAELLARATTRGFPDDDPQRREMIVILTEQHAAHGCRHIKPGTVYDRVSPSAAHHVVERLDDAVAALIDARGMIAA